MSYFAQMPDGFAYGSELNPAERSAVFDSLYVSLVTIGTLGFGDIVPTSPFLRVIVRSRRCSDSCCSLRPCPGFYRSTPPSIADAFWRCNSGLCGRRAGEPRPGNRQYSH